MFTPEELPPKLIVEDWDINCGAFSKLKEWVIIPFVISLTSVWMNQVIKIVKSLPKNLDGAENCVKPTALRPAKFRARVRPRNRQEQPHWSPVRNASCIWVCLKIGYLIPSNPLSSLVQDVPIWVAISDYTWYTLFSDMSSKPKYVQREVSRVLGYP